MNNKFSKCVFVTKEYWFDTIYNSNKFIIDQINKINLIEYQKIILKIKKLNQKQNENPINSRTQLIELKEIQKIIFENQFSHDYSFRQKLLNINRNPEPFLPRPIPLKNYRKQYLKGKVGLLKSIFEMERKICQLVFMKDITLLRNEMIVERNESQPNISTPKLRKLFQNWMNANQPLKKNGTLINMEYTNYLAQHMNNNFLKQEHRRIFKNVENDNYNLSLRFKKEHLKTNKCRYAIQERSSEEKKEFEKEILKKPIIPWNDLLINLGLNSLEFLNEHPIHKSSIINLLKLYLMPITETFDDVFILKREYYLMCISFILLDFNRENIDYLPEEVGTPGFTATTRINNSSIYKLENLRLSDYPKSSYMSSIYLFSFLIQKYLYNLKPSYVPNIEDIFYHFTHEEEEKIKSITKMNLVKRENNNRYQFSINLQQLLIKPIKINKRNTNKYFFEINNFEEFIILILKKLCKILIEFQDLCYFVHRDLHTGNIMINFNIFDNNFDINNFEVKLIDFTYSSIIINNEKVKTELINCMFNNNHDLKLSNPYINKNWNCYDLKYFFLSLLFARLYEGKQEKLEENYIINKVINSQERDKKLKNVRNIILSLLKIDNNYLAKYILFKLNYYKNNKNYKKKCVNRISQVFKELIFNDELLKEIMGEKCGNENFNPRFLLSRINNNN